MAKKEFREISATTFAAAQREIKGKNEEVVIAAYKDTSPCAGWHTPTDERQFQVFRAGGCKVYIRVKK